MGNRGWALSVAAAATNISVSSSAALHCNTHVRCWDWKKMKRNEMKTSQGTTLNAEMNTAVLAEEIPTKCQFISQISFEHLYVQTHMYRPMCVLYMFIHQVQCVASMCTSKTRSSTQADRHRQISYMYTDRTHSYRLLVLVLLPYQNGTCVSATMM